MFVVFAPPSFPPSSLSHHLLTHTLPLEQLHVVEGALVCTNCGREYPIKDGIPNMLLNDGEI